MESMSWVCSFNDIFTSFFVRGITLATFYSIWEGAIKYRTFLNVENSCYHCLCTKLQLQDIPSNLEEGFGFKYSIALTVSSNDVGSVVVRGF